MARWGGVVYLSSAIIHAQWVLGGASVPVVVGSLAVVATIKNGDWVGLSMLGALILGVAGGVLTLFIWSYSFSLTCLGTSLLYFFLLAPLAFPYLPFALLDVGALGLVVWGRHGFLDNPPPHPSRPPKTS